MVGAARFVTICSTSKKKKKLTYAYKGSEKEAKISRSRKKTVLLPEFLKIILINETLLYSLESI